MLHATYVPTRTHVCVAALYSRIKYQKIRLMFDPQECGTEASEQVDKITWRWPSGFAVNSHLSYLSLYEQKRRKRVLQQPTTTFYHHRNEPLLHQQSHRSGFLFSSDCLFSWGLLVVLRSPYQIRIFVNFSRSAGLGKPLVQQSSASTSARLNNLQHGVQAQSTGRSRLPPGSFSQFSGYFLPLPGACV